jgi:hypothetical protein
LEPIFKIEIPDNLSDSGLNQKIPEYESGEDIAAPEDGSN